VFAPIKSQFGDHVAMFLGDLLWVACALKAAHRQAMNGMKQQRRDEHLLERSHGWPRDRRERNPRAL
jgi:hypothetical protein